MPGATQWRFKTLDLDLLEQMQLDFFEDSRDVMFRNDAVDALERRDTSASRAVCDRQCLT